ncbi:MAG: UTP--glucose-1-phosphate uridylyltransferase [Clostridia bacterium]
MESLEQAKQILKKYKQEHLLRFYPILESWQQAFLISQILDTDFEQILTLYEDSKTDEIILPHMLEPLPYIDKTKLSKDCLAHYEKIGVETIKRKAFAVVTMAGGQGTRLGFNGPKGTFELDTYPKKSLFEIICDELKTAQKNYFVTIPWYIMTSKQNYKDTLAFFEKKNWFDYPKESIFFFQQAELPLIDVSGNLLLEEPYKIKEASNGNGDVFSSLKRARLLEQMQRNSIEWLFFSGVDNVLLPLIDPIFLGVTIANHCLVSSKTLRKENSLDKDWVFARKNGKPAIVDCSFLTDDMKIATDANGNDLYRDTNLLAHLFHYSAVSTICDKLLPYHRAFKKNTFINEEGMKQIPDKPNTFKFENFIFDAFTYFDNLCLLRVSAKEEYAPIKDYNGPYNPEIATMRYENIKLHRYLELLHTKKSNL